MVETSKLYESQSIVMKKLEDDINKELSSL